MDWLQDMVQRLSEYTPPDPQRNMVYGPGYLTAPISPEEASAVSELIERQNANQFDFNEFMALIDKLSPEAARLFHTYAPRHTSLFKDIGIKDRVHAIP